MIEVIKALIKALDGYKLHADELPLDYNFENVGMFYMLENVQDLEGNVDYDTQIHLVHSDKLKVLKQVELIDKLLNEKLLDGIRIFRKNIYLNHFIEEDKHTYILEYYARKYK